MTDLLQKSILDILGVSHAPDPYKQRVMNQLMQLVEKRVMLAVLDRLTNEEQEQFMQISEFGTDEERQVFLRTHVPEIGKIITNEVLRVKREAETYTLTAAAAA